MALGIAYSIFASVLFSILYYLSTRLIPLSGEGIFGFRMWLTLPFLIGAIFLFKQQQQLLHFLKRLKSEPKMVLVLLITTTITGSQMWLFLWAPNNGAAIDVSIGYLLMPIVMVATGKLFFKETLSLFKWISLVFALIGVLSNFIAAGSFSWATLMVLTGYPIYLGLRKYYQIAHLSSFMCEIILLLPVAAYFISQTDMAFVQAHNPNIYGWLLLLGSVSGLALIFYVTASGLVPLNLLGLLGYFEPAAMLVVAFLIGEILDPSAYLLMICLMIAILFLILDGIIAIKRQKKKVA